LSPFSFFAMAGANSTMAGALFANAGAQSAMPGELFVMAGGPFVMQGELFVMAGLVPAIRRRTMPPVESPGTSGALGVAPIPAPGPGP
jgi:hypothetical protein